MDNSALVVGGTDLLAVSAYLFLGWRFSVRKVAPENTIPILQFSAFWFALGLSTGVTAVESLWAVSSNPSLVTAVALYHLQLFALCTALWGLVGYLSFLYFGRSYLLAVSAAYLLLYGVLLYYTSAAPAAGVTVMDGTVGVKYATAVAGPVILLALVLLAVPVVGAILYFTLFFRTQDRTARYRIALVSWGILGFFGVGVIDLAARLGGGLVAVSLGAVLSLTPVAAILLAYYPPRAIRERLGVTGLEAAA